jgi:hypothetical protein
MALAARGEEQTAEASFRQTLRDRTEVQLQASVEPLYYDMSGATADDWHAILPNVAGLEFWTAATGGSQLTADGDGNLIDQEFSESTGEYENVV